MIVEHTYLARSIEYDRNTLGLSSNTSFCLINERMQCFANGSTLNANTCCVISVEEMKPDIL